jgi:divinyl chlorophyllide a 8-vinyl-reductase
MAGKKILLLGATGTIGRAMLPVLLTRGYQIVAFARPGASLGTLPDCEVRYGDVTDPVSIIDDGFRGDQFDCIISCLASRNGAKDDAWRIDYQAHVDLLASAKAAGVRHFIMLSAICLQKPKLAFQHAKLAFEQKLIESGLTYSIVRPTAYFKSLSGQVDRVRKGKPFLLFGDGNLTACKPISDYDLACYIADCIPDKAMHNRILPVGGPTGPITPRQQGELLFLLMGKTARFRSVPVILIDAMVRCLTLAGYVIPAAAKKAELARIGRYYATESMLFWNNETGAYDAHATPSTGTQTLAEHYRGLVDSDASIDLGEHAVF